MICGDSREREGTKARDEFYKCGGGELFKGKISIIPHISLSLSLSLSPFFLTPSTREVVSIRRFITGVPEISFSFSLLPPIYIHAHLSICIYTYIYTGERERSLSRNISREAARRGVIQFSRAQSFITMEEGGADFPFASLASLRQPISFFSRASRINYFAFDARRAISASGRLIIQRARGPGNSDEPLERYFRLRDARDSLSLSVSLSGSANCYIRGLSRRWSVSTREVIV